MERILDSELTVAVAGPSGTFGFALIPLLHADDRISRIVGIASRLFDPAEHRGTKMTYRPGDVRDRAALEKAFQAADVVVHLAFMMTGAASRETIRQINVEGTLSAFRAAAAVGADGSGMRSRSRGVGGWARVPSVTRYARFLL